MEPTRLSALIHLTCFPRTISHDEVVFLRTIHLGELCFFALRVIAIETIETLRRRQLAKAAKCLAQGAIIGKLLHRTFVVLNTMPRKHFEDFREYTEHASAVQSRGYQLFDIYYRSVDARKEEVFGKTPSLFDLCRFRHESFVSLKAIISDPTLRGLPGWDPVEANARELDESLKSWRGLHIAFAIKYLQGITPPTGGTAGEPYLRVFLDEGLFSDTVIDKSLLQRLSSDAEWQELISYVPVGYGVAPPAEKRGLTLPRVDPTK